MFLGISGICTADEPKTIGSKVVDNEFWPLLEKAIEQAKFGYLGQAFIALPEAIEYVSCGVANRKFLTIDDYVIRLHRGEVSLFAKREKAAKTESLAAIVYTSGAYCADPQVTPKEAEKAASYRYMLVAVLANAGPQAALSPYRFVSNLAGGNRAFSPDNGYTLEKAIQDAKDSLAYTNEWIVVAD